MPITIVSDELDHKLFELYSQDADESIDGLNWKAALPLAEFERFKQAFRDGYQINGSSKIKNTRRDIQFDQVDNLFKNIDIPDGHRSFLAIYLGLNQQDMVYGLKAIVGSPSGNCTWDIGRNPLPSHIINSRNQVVDFLETSRLSVPDAWPALERSYFDTVRRVDDSGSHALIRMSEDSGDPKCNADVHRIIMPWDEEIKAMYLANVLDIDENYELVLESISMERHVDPCDPSTSRLRHGVALFTTRVKAIAGREDLVRDGDQLSVFHLRAVDYGSLCPPKCKEFSTS